MSHGKPSPSNRNFPRLAELECLAENAKPKRSAKKKTPLFPRSAPPWSKFSTSNFQIQVDSRFHMVSHCFYVTTKSTNLRHGLTKLHLSIYDSKWVAGVTAVWGLVFLYSKPTCSTCLRFFPGKSFKIMK